MKVVKIQILPAKDSEIVTAVVIEESKDGGSWKESSRSMVTSGTPEATRTIILDDGERLVIEGTVDYEIVYDPKQMAAVRVPVSVEAKKNEAEKQKQVDERNKKIEADEAKAKEAKEGPKEPKEGLMTETRTPPIDSKMVKEEAPKELPKEPPKSPLRGR